MSAQKKGRHLLTVLVEDYFHVGAFEKLIHQKNWGNFETRYEANTRKALNLLDQFGAKATFFVLGWIAEQSPELLREIVERGHEVASRGFFHRSVRHLTRDEFRQDILRTNEVIEAATDRRVLGYRAAEKLEYEKQDWVLDVLSREGFRYDASFMPDRSTVRERRAAHEVKLSGGSIWEFPYSTIDLGVGVVPISGGNYFRQIPYTLTRHAVKRWSSGTDEPFVSYFHVWELDPEQPRISAASRFNRVRHYRKLDKMEWILHENLAEYECVSIASHLGIDEPRTRPFAAKSAVEPVKETSATRNGLIPVSIVIPCYNEAETLPYLANTLEKVESAIAEKGFAARYIFVDDRSTDTTFDKLKELFADRPATEIIRHSQNLGVAAGIMTGIRHASTDLVASMDCDCTYDPLGLREMLSLMTENVDLVTASPYHRDGAVRNVPGWRLALSKGASFLYRRILPTKLDTYTSCFRVYRRSAFASLDIAEPGFLGIAEMLGKLDIAGGRIVEFPAVLEVRLFGASKMKTLRTIRGHLALLARLGVLRMFRKSGAIETSSTLDDTAKRSLKARDAVQQP